MGVVMGGGWSETARHWVVHVVRWVGICVGGEQGGIRASSRMLLELLDFALLCDGVHLGEEDGGEKDASNGEDGDRYGGVMEVDGSEVVDNGPGSEDRDDEDSGAGHPAAFVEVTFDLENRHAKEECEEEEKEGVDMEEEEGFSGDITLGISISDKGTKGGVDDIPLCGDDDLHHHHEEQGQQLIHLWNFPTQSN